MMLLSWLPLASLPTATTLSLSPFSTHSCCRVPQTGQSVSDIGSQSSGLSSHCHWGPSAPLGGDHMWSPGSSWLSIFAQWALTKLPLKANRLIFPPLPLSPFCLTSENNGWRFFRRFSSHSSCQLLLRLCTSNIWDANRAWENLEDSNWNYFDHSFYNSLYFIGLKLTISLILLKVLSGLLDLFFQLTGIALRKPLETAEQSVNEDVKDVVTHK